jgi:hypothetical protein
MGGLWSRALLPLHYFNQNTSVLNPSASTNNYAAPREFLFHGKYCQLYIIRFIVSVQHSLCAPPCRQQ